MKRRRHQRNEPEIEDIKDMLSDLPDSILLHILSFLNARDAVQTCLLSTRWKHLWKHLSTLNLCSSDFRNLRCFSKFVNRILSLRDSSTALNALDFKRNGTVEPYLLKKVLSYAASHNVNRLRIGYGCCRIPFPPSFSCQSLTFLELEYRFFTPTFPNSLNLPALTYLKLNFLGFCSGNDGRVEPFSTFNKLNTLILHECRVLDAQPLCISSITLLNLSIHNNGYHFGGYSKIQLFAPSLRTFAFSGDSFRKLSGSHLSSIKQVSIDVHKFMKSPVDWLIKMTDIKSLIVCPRTLQALSLVPDILKLKLPSLCNLKSLKLNLSCNSYGFIASSWRDIKMELARGKSWKENAKLREAIREELEPRCSSIIDKIIEFLLQNLPSAKVDVTY